MNDFFLLNNESLPYVFIDQNIEIKQIQVKNLNRFAQFADPIKKLESYSIETITPLVEPQMLNIMGMCSLVTTIDPELFSNNVDQPTAIAELLLKVIEVNGAFFKKKEEKETDSKDSSWFEAFAYLINHGHRQDEVMNMSYGAFLKYLIAGLRVDHQQVKAYAIATRMASGANKRDWEKYLKQLDLE